MQDNQLVVAVVLKPQGIRGEIKVKVYTDYAEDLDELERVIIGDAEYKVLRCRPDGNCAYLTLRGIADRNQAELLRGNDVIAYRDELPALPEGRYYIVDLIGCKVITEEGEYLGDITGVIPSRTDVYQIKTPTKETMFAGVDGVILSVDIQSKVMTVNKKAYSAVVVD